MIEIGSYLLLIISLVGQTLSVDCRFSEDDIATFLHYIFKLHNEVRFKHKEKLLTRTVEMDAIAYQKMDDMDNNRFDFERLYGINHNSMYYDQTTKLDGAEAIKFFSLWYEQGNFYNYSFEPDNRNAGGFTQIVWLETKLIGLTFKCEENRYIVLAVYEPIGNIIGRYLQNVDWPLSNRRARDPENNELSYKTETEKFLNYILKLHSEVRAEHGVQPLRRSIRLDVVSRNMLNHMSYVEKLICLKGYGMNDLTRVYDDTTRLDDVEAKAVFSKWYNTGENYNYLVEPSNNVADAFTQIVWKDTQRIGIAIGRENHYYKVVVIYEPSGNIFKEFISNVLMPQSMNQGGSSGDN